jgi:hypothetical protein
MLSRITKRLSSLSVEDRIVLLRFKVGAVYGMAVYLATLLLDPLTVSRFAWPISVIVYYFTIPYVGVAYNPQSKFQLYLRGLVTYYATWLLVPILLNELFRTLGVLP